MPLRPKLDDFSSIICFKALITGIEDTLSPEGAAAAFIQAGRLRGKSLATQLGVAGSKVPAAELGTMLNNALGTQGTKLCTVDGARMDGDDIIVDTSETVCSAGEPSGSPRRCTFTLGAVWGAVETVYGRPYLAAQCSSVLAGGSHDSFRFTPV